MRPFLFVLLAAAVLAPGAAPGPVQVASIFLCEPMGSQNDAASGRDATEEDPVAVSTGRSMGCTDWNDSDDVFRIHIDQGVRYEVTFEALGCGDFLVYAQTRHPAPFSGDSRGLAGCASVVIADEMPVAADLEIGLHRWTGNGTYAFTVKVGDDVVGPCEPHDDAGSGRDASGANPVAIAGGAAEACIDRLDNVDVFTLEVAEGDRHAITFDPVACGPFHLDLEGFGTVLADGYVSGCGPWTALFRAVAPGVLQIEVRSNQVETVYHLRVEEGPADVCGAQDDGGSGGDANAWWPPLLPEPQATGCLDAWDRSDGYRLAATAGETVRVRVESPDCVDLRVALGDPRSATVASGEGCEPRVVEWRATKTATLELYVGRIAGAGDYRVTTEREACAAPVPLGDGFTVCPSWFLP